MPIVSRVLLGGLLLASFARAEDACLSGASTLGDQRGFATFRAALDTACPCDAAAKRGHYRRCAKGVLKTALGDGILRDACEKPAKRLVKGATCGTSLVACGRVTPNGDPVATCQTRSAKSCKDKVRFAQTD